MPMKLVCIWSWISSCEASSREPPMPMPALQMRTSTLPSLLIMELTADWTEWGSRTSIWRKWMEGCDCGWRLVP